ncbi:MAG: hypothetical protein ABL984_21575 [Pyrinomonadaceae bacterium]
MSDYKNRFDKWQRDAKGKFEEIDKQLGLKDKIEEGARVVAETAQKGAERIKAEAEKSEVGKQAVKVAEETVKTASETAKKAWDASEPVREAAEDAAEKTTETASDVLGVAAKKAGEFFDGAKETVSSGARTFSDVFNFGASWSRTLDSTVRSISKASGWIQENPLQAAATGASMAVGAGLGVVFTGISSHWLFNSALPAWSVKKLGESFNDYLRIQEKKIAEGNMDEAKAERIKFEADIARRIGAPMLGAFSFASGAVMMTNILNPKEVTGAPISWLLGGNPLLEGVWFFGNGLVCFKTSYDFFMIALDGDKDVETIVREVKGMLPKAAEQN